MFKSFLVLFVILASLQVQGLSFDEHQSNTPAEDLWSRPRKILRSQWEERRENIFLNEFSEEYARLKALFTLFKDKYGSCGNDETCLKKLYLNQLVYYPQLGPGKIIHWRPSLRRFSYEHSLHTASYPQERVVTIFEFLPEKIYLPLDPCEYTECFSMASRNPFRTLFLDPCHQDASVKCLSIADVYQHFTYGLGTLVAINPHEEKLLFRPYANNWYFYPVLLRELVPTKRGCFKGEEFCVGQLVPHPTKNYVGTITSLNPRNGKLEVHFLDGEVLNILPNELPGQPFDYGELCEKLSSMGSSCQQSMIKESMRESWVSYNEHLYTRD